MLFNVKMGHEITEERDTRGIIASSAVVEAAASKTTHPREVPAKADKLPPRKTPRCSSLNDELPVRARARMFKSGGAFQRAFQPLPIPGDASDASIYTVMS